MDRVRGSVAGATVAVAMVLCAFALTSAASASPASGPTTAVSIGDSYISGEAGRWAGNSTSLLPGSDGTDRACVGQPVCSVDKTRVYEAGTENGGCHRSDVAEILSAQLAVDQRDNISCSGAVTKNVFRAASGGEGQRGEPAQADQLAAIAQARRVKLIVVSIGGNDLGFASIVQACFTGYIAQTGPCEPSQQAKIDALKPKVQSDIAKAIDEIRAVMSQAGYASGDYRLVLQTYPSVAPRASEVRYPESPAPPLRTVNGCPFYDSDATWARDSAAPQIGGVVRAAASSRGVEVLDLIDAFQGHEFCSTSARQSMLGNSPPPSEAEWGRIVGPTAFAQGEIQEVFHPNAYGQQALGACVTQLAAAAAAPGGRYACSGKAGIDPSRLSLTLAEPGITPRPASGSAPAAATKRTSCLAARAAVGARRIGRVALGVSRTRLIAAPSLAGVTRPVVRATRYRYCVKNDRGGVFAVFGKGAKVELIAATAARYGLRGVRPGVRSSALRRAYRRNRAVGSGVYRISPRSQRIVGIRGGKVRFVGVASKRVLGSRALVRAYVKRAGL